MKKRYIIVLVFVLFCACSYFSIDANDLKNEFRQKGENVADRKEELIKKKDSTVIVDNEFVFITSDDIFEEVVLLSSNNPASKDDIIASSSEKEFEEYKESITQALENAENKEDIEAYIDAIGGVDAYFKIMSDRLKNGLIVRKYLDDEKMKYAKKNGYILGDAEFEILWNEKEERLKSSIIDNVKISNIEKKELEREVEREAAKYLK